jgi:hypothetical protein
MKQSRKNYAGMFGPTTGIKSGWTIPSSSSKSSATSSRKAVATEMK